MFRTAQIIHRLTIPAAMVGAVALFAGPVFAQAHAEETAVIATVQHLFDAMAARDTVAARSILLPEGRFFSIREDGDRGIVRSTTHRAFLAQLGTAAEEAWLERMWNPRILIHGRMAMLWTAYDFHRDGAFSHCGVDAFSLLKTSEGWKIAGTTYTVEPTGCEASPLGPPGHR
ncbi:MAG: nuclear transport factor 2 family protein [Rhodothermales bacterium]